MNQDSARSIKSSRSLKGKKRKKRGSTRSFRKEDVSEKADKTLKLGFYRENHNSVKPGRHALEE